MSLAHEKTVFWCLYVCDLFYLTSDPPIRSVHFTFSLQKEALHMIHTHTLIQKQQHLWLLVTYRWHKILDLSKELEFSFFVLHIYFVIIVVNFQYAFSVRSVPRKYGAIVRSIVLTILFSNTLLRCWVSFSLFTLLVCLLLYTYIFHVFALIYKQ